MAAKCKHGRCAIGGFFLPESSSFEVLLGCFFSIVTGHRASWYNWVREAGLFGVFRSRLFGSGRHVLVDGSTSSVRSKSKGEVQREYGLCTFNFGFCREGWC
ncbi:hypothetical protein BDA99DRAFT_536938 [Phascolomyces articulosus]|uniref:Uncharacterized protein n=1 Tax=Phascolomyces articulosus TaxID=60185 RepID=A0AAD5K1B9_9FUNG|nr:hypothetical protein BDA99DRAFT_536938 [Phascolomyces articulosus]